MDSGFPGPEGLREALGDAPTADCKKDLYAEPSPPGQHANIFKSRRQRGARILDKTVEKYDAQTSCPPSHLNQVVMSFRPLVPGRLAASLGVNHSGFSRFSAFASAGA